MKLLAIWLFFLQMILPSSWAEETCSRIASISYQDILIDSNSTQKGEGLRFYLEKDPIARSYLDTYQRKNKITWPKAILGTTGTLLTLSGALMKKDDDKKKPFLFGGLSLIMVNFFVAKTLEYNNEKNLYKAIDEYNKRNLPKIFLKTSRVRDKDKWGIGIAWSRPLSF